MDDDPLAALAGWIADAGAGDPAMVLATVGPDGTPHARTVLVTGIVAGALRFHTSAPTQKTRDLAVHPQASGVFWWPERGRQAVVGGPVSELARDATVVAFRERPEQLRRLAWVYDTLLPGLSGPLQAVEPGAAEAAFATAPVDGAPPSWTTFALVPERIELWQSRGPAAPASRTRYVRHGDGWQHATVLP